MAGYVPANRGNRSAAHRTGAIVSRRLSRAGFNVSPAARRHIANGLFVRGTGGLVSILVDFGTPWDNERVTHGIVDQVITWDEVADGSVVTAIVPGDPSGAVSIRFTYGTEL